jgi:hypothetical protein
VWLCCSCGAESQRESHDLGQCSHLCMSSLFSNSIGEAGARELLTALQFNKSLAELK